MYIVRRKIWGQFESGWSRGEVAIIILGGGGAYPLPPYAFVNDVLLIIHVYCPQTADKVISLYKKALNESKSHNGQVSHLINLEETKNGEQGSRFLLELMIELRNPSELINTSEYVYLPKGEERLCHTSNFQWMKNVDVHLIVSGGCG